ncbi:GDF3 factor, partial [Furnarius figulus]|nr:GDF3 factor [Furnarius figulus]
KDSRAMWLLPSLAWALLSSVLPMELSLQESLLLKSLGLSARPSPKTPIPVPPVLWRIFQERKTQPSMDKDPEDACRVEEFNVPGDIIRVFADQGTDTSPFGCPSGMGGSAPLLPSLSPEAQGGQSWFPGEIP